MRNNKYIYTLSALMMACIISFSGVGGSYIQAHATSVGIPRPGVWNDDVSAWENIYNYLRLYMSYMGAYVNPSGLYYTAQDFYDFMTSDGVSHDVAHGIFCDCDDSTHTSFSGNEHGGGGFVRDGISVDDDGNVTYSDEVSDLFYGYICNYLETESGYWVVETLSADEFPVIYVGYEDTKQKSLVDTIKNLGVCYVDTEYYAKKSIYPGTLNISVFKSDVFVMTTSSSVFNQGNYFRNVYNDDVYGMDRLSYSGSDSLFNIFTADSIYSLDDFSCSYVNGSFYFQSTSSRKNSNGDLLYSFSGLVTSDGRLVKVFKSLDAMRNFNIKQQPYYYTQNWVNYDASQDNSITMTSAEYQYYSDNSTTIFQTIQNNIDNGGEALTEQDIQKIVEDTVKNVLDNIPSGGGSDGGGSDSGDSDNGDDENGGTGVGAIIEGIGKLFDTILTLIGKLMGVVADFTQSILDLFSGFTTFTDGFSGFLAGAFGFIPAEIWNVIQVGLSLMILLAVIKFLRK